MIKWCDWSDLQQDGEDDERADAVHHPTEVGEKRLPTAPGPDVEVLCAVLVVVMGGVIGQVMLDAGAGWAGVTAAEGDAVHQELPLHVTEETTEDRGGVRVKHSQSDITFVSLPLLLAVSAKSDCQRTWALGLL